MYKVVIFLSLILGVFSAPAIANNKRDQRHSAPQSPRSTYVDPYSNEPPHAYDFGYSIHNDDGSSSYQREMGDHAGRKTGSYSYQGPDGLYRTVKYVADEKGFRVTIETNEPGTKDQKEGPVKVSTSRRNKVFTRVQAEATNVSRRIHQKFDVTPKGLPKQKLLYMST